MTTFRSDVCCVLCTFNGWCDSHWRVHLRLGQGLQLSGDELALAQPLHQADICVREAFSVLLVAVVSVPGSDHSEKSITGKKSANHFHEDVLQL